MASRLGNYKGCSPAWGYPSSVLQRRNEPESACPNYLQRDDPFLSICMARSLRAKAKHKIGAIVEINRRRKYYNEIFLVRSKTPRF